MTRLHRIVDHLSVSPPTTPSTFSLNPHSTFSSSLSSTILLIRELDSLLNASPSLPVSSPSSSRPPPVSLSTWLSLPSLPSPPTFRTLPHSLTQAHLDAFSSLTLDYQFIHQHDAVARGSPFPHPIAHGFLLLSMLVTLVDEAVPRVEGASMGLNYGLEKVRWMAPLGVGEVWRGEVRLLRVDRVKDGVVNALEVTVRVEEREKPVMVAVWLTKLYIDVDS